jgi:hypothetical protein
MQNHDRATTNPSGGGDYLKKIIENLPKKLFVLQIVVHKIVTQKETQKST